MVWDDHRQHDRPKCPPTRKTSFSCKRDAESFMEEIKWRHNHPIRREDGSRRKHRMKGKPKLQRAYYCPHCTGFHITTWELWIYTGGGYPKRPPHN